MCNADVVAHSSRPRTSPEGGKPLEPHHHPCQHPRKNVQLPNRPHHQQTPLWPATVVLGRIPGRVPAPAPPAGAPPAATEPCPALLALHAAEHFVQRVTDCAQSDLDSSLSAQNVTLHTKRHPVHKTSPHTTPTHTTRNPGCRPARPRRGRLPPTRPGTPTPTDRTRTTHTSLRNLRPTPQNSYTTRSPTPPTPQTPPPRTSTVLTTNKYRSREQ